MNRGWRTKGLCDDRNIRVKFVMTSNVILAPVAEAPDQTSSSKPDSGQANHLPLLPFWTKNVS